MWRRFCLNSKQNVWTLISQKLQQPSLTTSPLSQQEVKNNGIQLHSNKDVTLLTESCHGQDERDHDGDPGDPESLLPVALGLVRLQAHAALQEACSETHTLFQGQSCLSFVCNILSNDDIRQPEATKVVWFYKLLYKMWDSGSVPQENKALCRRLARQTSEETFGDWHQHPGCTVSEYLIFFKCVCNTTLRPSVFPDIRVSSDQFLMNHSYPGVPANFSVSYPWTEH